MEVSPFAWYDIEITRFVVSYNDVLHYIPNEDDMLNLIESNANTNFLMLLNKKAFCHE